MESRFRGFVPRTRQRQVQMQRTVDSWRLADLTALSGEKFLTDGFATLRKFQSHESKILTALYDLNPKIHGTKVPRSVNVESWAAFTLSYRKPPPCVSQGTSAYIDIFFLRGLESPMQMVTLNTLTGVSRLVSVSTKDPHSRPLQGGSTWPSMRWEDISKRLPERSVIRKI